MIGPLTERGRRRVARPRSRFLGGKGVAGRRTATCLVVDDEPLIRWSLVRFLEARGLEARSVGSGETALALLQEWPADLLISDIRLPGIDGLELARRCQGLRPRPRIIFITASDRPPPSHDLDRLGVLGVLEKPLVLESLAQLLPAEFSPSGQAGA